MKENVFDMWKETTTTNILKRKKVDKVMFFKKPDRFTLNLHLYF